MKNPTTSPKRHQILDLPIHLDEAIRNQSSRVHAALRSAIVDGRLDAGLRLPSSRSLADQLRVNRNAVVAAYEHLVIDGLLEARHGAGTYVAQRLPSLPPAMPAPVLKVAPAKRHAFALGRALVDEVLLRKMAGYARRRIATAGIDELGYGDPRGSEYLRTQIAQHLAANRGVRCDPNCVLVVPGVQHALRLCVAALFSSGDAVWMEDPGYFATQRTFQAAGLKLVPIPVDAEGLDVDTAQRTKVNVRGAYVTPSHQFPTGATMSMRRRIALTDWARSTQSWIFEDDYDSEFRYTGPPLTALAGLGSERVIYIGTFTKTLFAGLRLAYLVVPPSILKRVVAARSTFDRFAPVFAQDIVGDLMASGTLSSHIRRMRARYQEARDVVIDTLRKAAGESLDVGEPTQGLHLVAELPSPVSKSEAAHILAMANVEALLLSEARLTSRGSEGFILGFSGFEYDELKMAAQRLGDAARKVVGVYRK